jgi:small-conductance mechanosensitive channel
MKRIRFISLIYLAIILSITAFSQEEKPETIIIGNDTIVVKAIPLEDVSQRIEKTYKELTQIKEKLDSYNDQRGIDSLVMVGKNYLTEQTKRVENYSKSMSERELLDEKKQWKKIRKGLDNWREKFNHRSAELSDLKKQTELLLRQWTMTYDEAKKKLAPLKLKKSIKSTLEDIRLVNDQIKSKENQLYLNQNAVTDFILRVDEIIGNLEEQRLTYFQLDASPIWQIADSAEFVAVAPKYISRYFDESSKNLKRFTHDVKTKMALHTFILLLLIGFIYLLRWYLHKKSDEIVLKYKKAAIIINNYILTGFFLALLVSGWIYPIRPSIINDILLFLVLLNSLILLYKLYGKPFIPVIITVTILWLINDSLIVLNGNSMLARFFLYIDIIYAGFVFIYIRKIIPQLEDQFKNKVWNVLFFFFYVFMLFLLVSFIGNTFGFVNLSILLTHAVVNAIIMALIYSLLTMTLNSIIAIVFETGIVQKSNIIRDNKESLLNSITNIVGIVIIIIWFNSIISQMGLSDAFWGWLRGIIDTEWVVGTTTIKVGAIIGVILVIIITTVIIRIVNALLNKELFPRVELPRGVPGAVSMIIKYIIVGFGIYFVLSVAGIDLGKFGLIAGALGVGIGFGLQNIVFNFIAGLVLAFERPFQVGDVIEVDQLMGIVTSIGVRSSTIKTYDGSEVIVPNGNLISTDVINWTLSDRRKRREIPVSVAYGSNPREVMDILLKVAGENVNVLKNPAPWATFEGFGESSLDFKIRFWVALDIGMTVKSEVAMSIYDALEEAGIEIPFPQQDLYIKEFNEGKRTVSRKKTVSKKNVKAGAKDKPGEKKNNDNESDDK